MFNEDKKGFVNKKWVIKLVSCRRRHVNTQ